MAKKAKTKIKTKKTIKKAIKKTVNKSAKKTVKKPVKKTAQKSPAKKTEKKPAKKGSESSTKSSSSSVIGKSVASFTLPNSKGESVSLKSYSGKNIVLYFYPKDDTPGCTLEGQEFSALVSKFSQKNTVVFGVSKDSVESHDKFICKYDYKIELLSDADGKLCDFFDVIKEKNMYGKKFMGIERSTFIIDSSGQVVHEFRKVSPPGHAQFILDQIS